MFERCSKGKGRLLVVAAFNFILWGLGYVWISGRKLLGVALSIFVISLLTAASMFAFTPTEETLRNAGLIVAMAWFFTSSMLAVDAYRSAKAEG